MSKIGSSPSQKALVGSNKLKGRVCKCFLADESCKFPGTVWSGLVDEPNDGETYKLLNIVVRFFDELRLIINVGTSAKSQENNLNVVFKK